MKRTVPHKIAVCMAEEYEDVITIFPNHLYFGNIFVDCENLGMKVG